VVQRLADFEVLLAQGLGLGVGVLDGDEDRGEVELFCEVGLDQLEF
jgi:hypothetical protein